MNANNSNKKQKVWFRRSLGERRGWSPMPESPFEDCNGELVTRDRRTIMDRRVSERRKKKHSGFLFL